MNVLEIDEKRHILRTNYKWINNFMLWKSNFLQLGVCFICHLYNLYSICVFKSQSCVKRGSKVCNYRIFGKIFIIKIFVMASYMPWTIFNKFIFEKSVLCNFIKKCVITGFKPSLFLCSEFYALVLFNKKTLLKHVSHKSLFAKTFLRFWKLDKVFLVHFEKLPRLYFLIF